MKSSRALWALSICLLCLIFGLAACTQLAQPAAGVAPEVTAPQAVPYDPQNLATATFAGGCFWSMQRMMDEAFPAGDKTKLLGNRIS